MTNGECRDTAEVEMQKTPMVCRRRGRKPRQDSMAGWWTGCSEGSSEPVARMKRSAIRENAIGW
jgi:hypothetical protein